MGRTFKDYGKLGLGIAGLACLIAGSAVVAGASTLTIPNKALKKILKVGIGSFAYFHRFGYNKADKIKLLKDIVEANKNRNTWQSKPEHTLCLPVIFDIYQELLEIDTLFREYSRSSKPLTQNNLVFEKGELETSRIKVRINESIKNISGRLNQFDTKSHVKNTVATSHFLEKIGIFSNQLLCELDEGYRFKNKDLYLRRGNNYVYPENSNEIKESDTEEVKRLKQFNQKVNQLYFKFSSYNNVAKDQKNYWKDYPFKNETDRDRTESATTNKGYTISLFTSHLYDRYFYGNYIKDDAVSISGELLNTEFITEETDEKIIEKTTYLKTNVLITKVCATNDKRLLSDEFKDLENGLITKRNYEYFVKDGKKVQYLSELVMTTPFKDSGSKTTCSSFGSNGELEKRVITTSNLITTENYVENKLDSKIEQILSDDKTIKTIIEYNGSGDETNRQEFIVGDVSYHEELQDFYKDDLDKT